MNKFLKVLLITIKIIFLLIIIACTLGATISAYMPDYGIQVKIFIVYSVILALAAFFYMFIDLKIKNTIFFVLLLVIYMLMTDYMPEVKYNMDLDMCYDDGLCSENLEINTDYGKVLINKENCIKYNWKWNDEKHFCSLRN